MIDLDDEENLRLIELFRQKAADRRFEVAMRSVEQLDDEHKRRRDLKLRKEEEERKLEEAVATTAQVAAFDEHLDNYDTATVHALMDNQHALDLVLRQRQEMEAAAFRLPDGRMAFKAEDGRRVFDRHGTELAPETIHPDAIPDSAPTWEADQRIKATEEKLLRERDQLHDYQKRVDEAREAAGKGDVTADALARMDADLKRDMPDAVKARLPAAAAEQEAKLRDEPSPAPGLTRAVLPALAPAGP